MLTEGYVEGDRQTAKVVLKANPYFWNKRDPQIETITVYTELDTNYARDATLYQEGQLDIAVIPAEYKVQTIMAPYSKLVVCESTDNVPIHFNLINGNPRLRDRAVRRALNEALNQPNLLHFVYKSEGHLSPISPHFPGVREVSKHLLPVPADHAPYAPHSQARLRRILEGLTLKVLTQDRFVALWRGIETQLKRVGVRLDIELTSSEKDIFESLLQTNAGKNSKQWDLLIWGNDDWYFNHPFTAFVVFRTHKAWSTVYPDKIMDGYIEEMFREPTNGPEFPKICEKIMRRAYDEGYMLFVPTPNKVFAVNKEVVFRPYKMACMPLWKIQVTDQHWSVRPPSVHFPNESRLPVRITRIPAGKPNADGR